MSALPIGHWVTHIVRGSRAQVSLGPVCILLEGGLRE